MILKYTSPACAHPPYKDSSPKRVYLRYCNGQTERERQSRKREREKVETQQQNEEKEDGNRVIAAAAAVEGMGDLLTPEVHYVGRGGEGRGGHGPLRKG